MPTKRATFAGVTIWTALLVLPVFGSTVREPFPDEPAAYARACSGLDLVGSEDGTAVLVETWLSETYGTPPAVSAAAVAAAIAAGCGR